MPKYIVTYNSMVIEAEDASEAIERGTDAGGGHWEAVPVEAFGATLEAVPVEPNAGASTSAPWPVLLDIRGQIEIEIRNANDRVNDLTVEMRSDIAAIEDAVKDGSAAPSGITSNSFVVQDTAAQLVAALARRKSAYVQLAWINHAIEQKNESGEQS